MVLTLYKMDASPPARAAMMVLELLQVPNVNLQDVNLLAGANLTEEYLKINPQHTVPTLVDGDFVVWDSHAIVAYLVTQYATDDTLYPKDPKKRAVVDQRLHFDSGVLFPSFGAPVRKIVYKGGTSIEPEEVERYHTAYGFVEKFLSGGTWLAGDNITIADICCVATVSSMNELIPIDANKYPNITKWLHELSKKDFYVKRNQAGCSALGQAVRSRIVKA